VRIIGGTHRGRVLQIPAKLPVRPTTDFAREALFNILQNQFYLPDVSFLDLFTGTGAISLEMASRGCTDITSVDIHPGCVQFIRKTADYWKLKGCKTIKEDVFRFIEQCSFRYDIVFADPPYNLPNLADLPDLILKKKMVRIGGWLILEHGKNHSFQQHPFFIQHRRYGNVNFSIFQPQTPTYHHEKNCSLSGDI